MGENGEGRKEERREEGGEGRKGGGRGKDGWRGEERVKEEGRVRRVGESRGWGWGCKGSGVGRVGVLYINQATQCPLFTQSIPRNR